MRKNVEAGELEDEEALLFARPVATLCDGKEKEDEYYADADRGKGNDPGSDSEGALLHDDGNDSPQKDGYPWV